MGRLAAFLIPIFALTAQRQSLHEAVALDAAHKCEEAETVYRRMQSQGRPSAPLLNNPGNHYVMGAAISILTGCRQAP